MFEENNKSNKVVGDFCVFLLSKGGSSQKQVYQVFCISKYFKDSSIFALTLLSFITFLFYYKVRIISGIFLK